MVGTSLSSADRRASPRYRAEVLIDFSPNDTKTTGITYDVSVSGMFVRTSRLPREGQKIVATMRFADGRQLLIQGEVVRIYHPSVLLRGVLPTGFALTVKANESYRRFVESVAAEEPRAEA
ncbi:MAG TPA: PilZ domain-containing protein [Thermoanaerobaculia bacterium]|nr:PilZ domain-containing protein [Thermoanaerobaculia bacterium]